MNTVIKATIATAIIAMSYNATAKDGAFTGNIHFNNHTSKVVLQHYSVSGTADKSRSGVVLKSKATDMTFGQKLLSAADK
ncbi:hypothetical protein [Photobacterium angustum]|uniref:Uncharacterized protein n=1 Tax=Photobacterium angustum TaxID=661 RepID=A0A2S7VJR3_PHOAN|nr:hypothetical protein [Photobacterium angustum]PQJ61910.1 hypothetical protein BTO08_16730 [Photobacterium angustum]